MICRVCQAENDNGARFCSKCGTELLVPPPPDTDNADRLRQLNTRFFVLVGLILFFIVAAAAFVAYDVWRANNVQTMPFVQSTTRSSPSVQNTQSVTTTTSTSKVHVALIPEDTSPQGIALRSEYEKDIQTYLEKINFPKKLIRGRVIGIISPTFEGGTYTVAGRRYSLPKSVSGPYGIAFSDGSIFLNGQVWADKGHAVLTHELGHVLSNRFTTADWLAWAEIRGEPDGSAFDGWSKDPREDFAEEFKRVVGDHTGDPRAWENRTAWGSWENHLFNDRYLGIPVAPVTPAARAFVMRKLEEIR